MKTIAKMLSVALLVGVASTVNAAPMYLDIGTDYGNNGDNPCGDNGCTGTKQQIAFNYNSNTVVDLTDNSVVTAGGWNKSDFNGTYGLNNNLIGGFLPTLGSNGYGLDNNWVLTFGFTNLEGTATFSDGEDLPTVNYNKGTIEFYLLIDGVGGNDFENQTISSFEHIMNISVTGGGLGLGNLGIVGEVDFTGITSAYKDLFHFADFSACGGSSFFEITACNPLNPIVISFLSDQNTDPNALEVSQIGDKLYINPKTDGFVHNGSAEFTVPEPSVLALLGFGLLGFGFRSKKSA